MASKSIPVTANTPLKVGDQVQAEYCGAWWPAEVTAVNADGRVGVHYPGWDSSFDEIVSRERLDLGQPSAERAAAALPACGAGPVYYNTLDRLFLGEPVSRDTALHAGQQVHVEWGSSWWGAHVVSLAADGSVRVHYSGWDSSWDETVPRTRLQLPARGERIVTLHFERGWSLTGKLLETLPDGYLINRAEDHKVCVVNKQSVVYVEIDNPAREYREGIRIVR